MAAEAVPEQEALGAREALERAPGQEAVVRVAVGLVEDPVRGQDLVLELAAPAEPLPDRALRWDWVSALDRMPRWVLALMHRSAPVQMLRSDLAPTRRQLQGLIQVPRSARARRSATVPAMAPETRAQARRTAPDLEQVHKGRKM